MKSPLAKKLMVIDGITGVFFGNNFVTVTKSDDFTWPMLKPDIFATVMDHFTSGMHLLPHLSCTVQLVLSACCCRY